MATTQNRSGSDAAPSQNAFSYAQAAKGISSTTASTGPTSKAASGTITPAKDSAHSANTLPASPPSMNGIESGDVTTVPLRKVQKELEKSTASEDAQGSVGSTQGVGSHQTRPPSSVASPEIGTASTSTLGKDDDVTSLVNGSSESSAWENKSQGSTAVEKSVDAEQPQAQSKKGQSKDKAPAKPLYEAPPPAVNIWKQRAVEAAKSRPTQTPVPQKKPAPVPQPVNSTTLQKSQNEKSADASRQDNRRKSKHPLGTEGEVSVSSKNREKRQDANMNARSEVDEKAGQGRRESRSGRTPQKDEAVPVVDAPLPPNRDEQAWPTPEIAQDEDRKKSVPKVEKEEKERTVAAVPRAHGKNEWVAVPFTPTVVFNTPMPNSGRGGRGGRGGARGNSQASTRPGPYNNSDKDATGSTLANGDSKYARNDGTSRDEVSDRPRRSGSAGPPTKDGRASNGYPERTSRSIGNDAQPHRRNGVEETSSGPNFSTSPSTTTSKQINGSRQKPPRKFDSDKVKEEGSAARDGSLPVQGSRASSGAHGDEHGSRKPLSAVETSFPSTKQSQSERRNGPFGSYSGGRERGEGRGRGAGRGNRGGQHGFTNSSHQNGHVYQNGHPPGSYNAPRSPTSFSEQGSYFGPPQSRSYRGSRPQSVVVDSSNFGRGPNGYPSGQLPPLQTFLPEPYPYPVTHPMSAPFGGPYMDHYQLANMIQMQLEYYFSVENLCKDMFMRKHMDSQGFVFLAFIADFNRIKQLTTDLEMIKLVCYNSPIIEYRLGVDGKDRLRRKDGWDQWILNVPERDPSAQNDGPGELHHPPVPHPRGFDQQQPMRYPPSAPVTGPSSPGMSQNEAGYQSINEATNGLTPNGVASHPAKSGAVPVPEAEPFAPAAELSSEPATTSLKRPTMNPEADSFADDQVQSLKIIVRQTDPTQAAAPFPSASSRTFSNGSIDSRSINEELRKSDNQSNGTSVNGLKSTHGDERRKSLTLQRSLSPKTNNKTSITNPLKVYWVKDNDKPVDSLPPESTGEFYTDLRLKAFERREISASGVCPYDMDVLYQFWSHFLIRNFNTSMYNEFRHLAFDDFNHRTSDNGIRNLVKYYGEALSSQNTIRHRVARHYVAIVNAELPQGDRAAFKQLRSAWRNGALNMKNRKIINDYVDPDLKAALEA